MANSDFLIAKATMLSTEVDRLTRTMTLTQANLGARTETEQAAEVDRLRVLRDAKQDELAATMDRIADEG